MTRGGGRRQRLQQRRATELAAAAWLLQREITAVFPYRDDELGSHKYDRDLYRERPMIERAINRRKRFRRLATRNEKLAASYMARVTFAM